MAYTVDYTDGTKTAILVNDGTVDTTTDLKLIGKNYSRYGEVVAEDFLHLLENFAAGTAPSRPSEGQLWYDNTNNCMKYFDVSVREEPARRPRVRVEDIDDFNPNALINSKVCFRS